MKRLLPTLLVTLGFATGAYSQNQSPMIYITQLIYIQKGQESTFEAFERVAIPIIGRYNGTLLLRYRPDPQQVIEQTIETPYEIHLVAFERQEDLDAFFRDEERKQFVHLKEQAIREVWLIKGEKL